MREIAREEAHAALHVVDQLRVGRIELPMETREILLESFSPGPKVDLDLETELQKLAKEQGIKPS